MLKQHILTEIRSVFRGETTNGQKFAFFLKGWISENFGVLGEFKRRFGGWGHAQIVARNVRIAILYM